MVKATNLGQRHDLAQARWLDVPRLRRVLSERRMGSRPVVVGEVGFEDAEQVAFAEDDRVIEALSTDRADETLDVGGLPRGLRKSSP